MLFDIANEYFITLDKVPVASAANFPLYFIIQCSRVMGYELKGQYSQATPYLNLREGGFTDVPPATMSFINDGDAAVLNHMLEVNEYEVLAGIEMNAGMRFRLIDWYIAYLREHTQHMGSIRSLSVLRAVLH